MNVLLTSEKSIHTGKHLRQSQTAELAYIRALKTFLPKDRVSETNLPVEPVRPKPLDIVASIQIM